MIVAIDGPAGVGKSSVAKKCAEDFSLLYINSGLLYRIMTVHAIDAQTEGSSAIDIAPARLADEYRRYIRESSLYARCYSAIVDEQVGRISTIPRVRRLVNRSIALLKRGANCIIEGRDITSVVCQNAELKIYLDADIEIRAQRRAAERDNNYDTVLQSMRARDTIDQQREMGRLTLKEDTIKIDTTHLTFYEVCATIKKHIMRVLHEESA